MVKLVLQYSGAHLIEPAKSSTAYFEGEEREYELTSPNWNADIRTSSNPTMQMGRPHLDESHE